MVDGRQGTVSRAGAKKLRVEFADGTKQWCSAAIIQTVAPPPPKAEPPAPTPVASPSPAAGRGAAGRYVVCRPRLLGLVAG
jgi:hypothetical protein